MPLTREPMSGCCAATVYSRGTVRNAKEIPSLAALTIIWLDAKDKESIEYLSPIAKANVTVGDKVMMSFTSTDLTNLKNNTLYVELDAMAQKMGRKDRNDIRVGDFVVFGDGSYLEGGKPYKVNALSTQYGAPAVDISYWYTYYKRWERYGLYRISDNNVRLYHIQDEKEFK